MGRGAVIHLRLQRLEQGLQAIDQLRTSGPLKGFEHEQESSHRHL
jgi:hypothetical protein